jgi:hypothetical protein
VVSRPLRPPPPELCPILGKVMAAAADGFDSLRGPPAEGGLAQGMTRLPGTEQCTIRGQDWPRGRYRCISRSFGSDAVAQAEFDGLARRIDDCLTKPFWFPRAWQQGQPFEFAMGERLVTWTDRSTGPPSQIVLKVQRGLTGADFRLLLDLGAAP